MDTGVRDSARAIGGVRNSAEAIGGVNDCAQASEWYRRRARPRNALLVSGGHPVWVRPAFEQLLCLSVAVPEHRLEADHRQLID